MKKDNLVYIEHIQECIQKIVLYTKDIKQDEFLSNSMVSDAVIRNLEIIGEAVKQISDDFKTKYPAVEWKKIAGMRDKLIHDYIGVDLWAVWAVVIENIPELNTRVSDILKKESQH